MSAERGSAREVFQFPSSEMEPTIFTVSSQTVLMLALKDMETVAAGVQAEDVEDDAFVEVEEEALEEEVVLMGDAIVATMLDVEVAEATLLEDEVVVVATTLINFAPCTPLLIAPPSLFFK